LELYFCYIFLQLKIRFLSLLIQHLIQPVQHAGPGVEIENWGICLIEIDTHSIQDMEGHD